MKIEIKKIGDEYIASDKRSNIELIKTNDKDKLAKTIFTKAVGNFSSTDLAKYKKSNFRKIINKVDKSGDFVFYLGENTMKKSELRKIIKEEIILEFTLTDIGNFFFKIKRKLTPKRVAWELFLMFREHNLDIGDKKVKSYMDSILGDTKSKEEFYKLLRDK